MSDTRHLKLAVTGAPRTGKSTVAAALSILTGLPRTSFDRADQSPPTRPGGGPASARVPASMVGASLRSFEARVHNESALPGFVSDGSVLNEWAEISAQALGSRTTARERARHPVQWAKHTPDRIFLRRYAQALEGILVRRARTVYDGIIHLPLDSRPLPDDTAETGERRRTADRLLIDVIHRLNTPYVVVGGSLEDILTRVTGFYGLDRRVPVADAVDEALARSASPTTPRVGAARATRPVVEAR